jgi:pyruvate,water dikinase
MPVLWLDQPTARDARRVGGKAAALAQLAADFRVPPGFCLLADELDDWLAGGDAAASPAPLLAAVSEAYAALASRAGGAEPAVAVRSSAADEDGADASFAGQHETLLNVVGAQSVADAVVRCWRSGRSERASAYRAERGLPPARMAVLVQVLVPATAAAVAFSADPVSGAGDVVVVEAVRGLGESLVGGAVTPERYTVSKQRLEIVARSGGDQQWKAVPSSQGVREVALDDEERARPALVDAQALEVARLARDLEERQRHPVDVECAYDAGGQLFLLQCRPITATATAAPAAQATEWASPDDAGLTWRWGRQAFPAPLTPLMQSYLPFHTQGWLRDSRAQGTAGEIRIRFERGYYYSLWQPTNLTTWEEVDRRAREVECALPARWRDEYLPLLQADHARARALELPSLADGDLALALQENLTAQVRHFTIHAHMASFPYSAAERLLNWYLERFPGAAEADAFRLLQGLPNTSVEGAGRLWELSRMLDQEAEAALRAFEYDRLPEPFRAAWQGYLADFGHRTHALADPASATWQEDPAPVAGMVLAYAQHGAPNPADELRRLADEREAFTAEVRGRLAADELPAFEELLATARANYPLTEDHNYWIDQQSPADLRLLCAEFARRMVSRGALDDMGDIAFLALPEIVLWGFGLGDPLRPRVAQRKAELRANERVAPPDYLGAPPEPQTWVDRFGGPGAPLPAEQGSVQGVGASAGRAVGRARVAATLGEAQLLERGEVLVCASTDANWTPLFALAAALVTDTGGSLCHAAVVAREYRLPAVVGTHVATRTLRTGQLVEVDGASGSVRLLEP